jgi:hypothetical protein
MPSEGSVFVSDRRSITARRLYTIFTASSPQAATVLSVIAAPVPVVPPFVQHLVQRKAGELAYVPTRKPFHYRYYSYTWRDGRLTIRLVDRRYRLDALNSVFFSAQRFRGTLASCGTGRRKTMQLDGNQVYWDGIVAWRCVRTPAGQLVKLSATDPNLPDVALGIVVASGHRVAAA